MKEKLYDFEKMTVKEIGEICGCFAYCEDCPFRVNNDGLVDCIFKQVDTRPSGWKDLPIEKNLREFFGE